MEMILAVENRAITRALGWADLRVYAGKRKKNRARTQKTGLGRWMGREEKNTQKRGADFLVSVTIVVCHWGRPGRASERLAVAPRGGGRERMANKGTEGREGKRKQ